mmetsp:Transcript_33519/g.88014  ORF Transcript_33519/g.88014 Transcript_33519/m.88014 type:complete len:672 (+) Transcript_33519:311-2326(+)
METPFDSTASSASRTGRGKSSLSIAKRVFPMAEPQPTPAIMIGGRRCRHTRSQEVEAAPMAGDNASVAMLAAVASSATFRASTDVVPPESMMSTTSRHKFSKHVFPTTAQMDDFANFASGDAATSGPAKQKRKAAAKDAARPQPPKRKKAAGVAARMWSSVIYLFHDKWKDPGPEKDKATVRKIQYHLAMPLRSDAEMISKIICAWRRGIIAMPCSSGRPPQLTSDGEDASAQVWAEIFHDRMSTGVGAAWAADYVNKLRWQCRLKPLAESTYRRAAKTLLQQKIFRTMTHKQGTTDVNSPWAHARFLFALQLSIQMQGDEELADKFGLKPFSIHQVLWLDEKHMKEIVGNFTKWTYSIPKDPASGRYLPVENGGRYMASDRKERMKLKYANEVRLAFGLALTLKKVDGVWCEVAEKMEPFDYTNRMMIGSKRYEQQFWKAVDTNFRERGGKGSPWGPKTWPADQPLPRGKRYQFRYGDGWEAKVWEKVNATYCCVDELIEHVKKEADRIFEGSRFKGKYWISHDAMSAWTSKEAAKRLEKVFGNRLLRCEPAFATAIGHDGGYGSTAGKQVGNSPENSPLDTHAFATLMVEVRHHWCTDPEEFSVATPKKIAETLKKVWKVAPSALQIATDVWRFPKTQIQILERQGTVVRELDERTGRRRIPVYSQIAP